MFLILSCSVLLFPDCEYRSDSESDVSGDSDSDRSDSDESDSGGHSDSGSDDQV